MPELGREKRDWAQKETQDWKQILDDIDSIATESILLLSEDLRILWANKVALWDAGCAPSEILGRLCFEVTHQQESICEPPLHQCPVPELRRTGESVTVTHSHSYRKGDVVPFEISAHPIKDEGEILRIVHTSRAGTEPSRVEEAFGATREALDTRVERQLQRRNAYSLTFRELTVLSLVAAGKADREIATILGISPLTAQKHVSNIIHKMKAATRTEVGVRSVREGLVY